MCVTFITCWTGQYHWGSLQHDRWVKIDLRWFSFTARILKSWSLDVNSLPSVVIWIQLVIWPDLSLIQATERPLFYDERSICKLRCTEDDRFGRATAAETPPSENSTTHLNPTAICVREAHSRQIGKVLFEKQCRSRPHRRRAEQHLAVIVPCESVCVFWSCV